MKILYILLLSISINVQSQDWQFNDEFAPLESIESDFGVNMVFVNEMLVVSWPRIFTNNNNADNCGEVITYNKVNGKYQEINRLTAADLTGSCVNGDGFGFGLAYDNGKLAIGMPAGVRGKLGTSGGANDIDSKVFITTFDDNKWVLHQTLTNTDLGDGKGMGFHLVMENESLLVFAHEYDTIFGFTFPIATGVYVYEDSGSGFAEIQKLEQNFHLFGQDFDIENNQIIVGAWGEQALAQPGRIYIYEKSESQWQVVQTINDTRNSNLGNQIEISENIMVAGSVQAGGFGGVTVFNKDNNNQWNEVQFIQASDNTFNDQFGISVQLEGGELIVGAGAGQNSQQTLGAIYTFSKNSNGHYIEEQKLVASNPTDLFDRFAGNFIFNDTDMLVSSTSGGFNNGNVTSFHHFSRNDTTGDDKYNVNSKISGSWGSNDSDNQNINIEVIGNDLAVIFATLNHDQENLWLFGVGNIIDNIIDFENIKSTSGGIFGPLFNSNNVTIINQGEAQLEFNKCEQAIFSYNLPSIETKELVINKQLEIPGNECSNTNKSLPTGVSGAWFDPNRLGEGFTIYIFEENNQQAATITWYTYDENGQQLWLTGTGMVNEQTVNITDMKKYTGANIFEGTTNPTQFGNLSMTWNNCHSAIVSYDFSNQNLGAGVYTLSQLTKLDNTECDLTK